LIAAGLATASAVSAQTVDPLRTFARVEQARVAQGDTVGVLVTFALAPTFHVWPHEPVLPPAFAQLSPVATDIAPVALPPNARIVRIDWPEPSTVTVQYTGAPVELLAYADTVVARVLVRLAPDGATGRVTAVLRVRYQACDARLCYRPAEQDVSVHFQVVSR
jgi:hypothetical protein